ncbi:MAG: fatty acid desaturase family protein, partial [Rhodanobacteraceae bacterium]
MKEIMIATAARSISPAEIKAEHEREKQADVRDYEAEQHARQINMAQLRDLRLANQVAEAEAKSCGAARLQARIIGQADRRAPQPNAKDPSVSLGHNSMAAAPDWEGLAQTLRRYRTPSPSRSVLELIVTGLPLVLLWTAAWFVFWLGYAWASPLVAIPAAGFLVRLFAIQHDCGHGTFFSRRDANDWVGRIIGVLTLTPYGYWRRTHAMHHATAGNLGRRGMGDVHTLTVHEYRDMSRWGRLRYRLYRHPLVIFGIGPAYLFLLQHRFPIGLMHSGWRPWLSTIGTNVAIAVVIGALVWLIGVKAFLLVHLPVMLLAATAGVWLFYVQH